MVTIKEFLKKTLTKDSFGHVGVRDRALCKDGFNISIQANWATYCHPRADLDDCEYEDVELGFPSEADDLIKEYAEDSTDLTDTVYGWVPVTVVQELVDKHGGIIGSFRPIEWRARYE